MSDVRLRLAEASDATAVRRIYAPYVEETAITFDADPPSVAALRERIRSKLDDYPWVVAEADGDVVGYAYAGPVRERVAYQWSVESSLYVERDAHRSGIGSALYEALLALLERQGYVTVYGVVTLPNPASAAIHEAFGFEREGTFERMGYKHGEWHDVGWWSLALREHPAEPEEPTPLFELRERAAWNDALAAGDLSMG
ncbi:N-acetyltransferase [Halarchaeum grantii]|uniref:N-acetyltransferase n=1 Tax=Halarchaeum grantii TaxID=1193105 RepID=A0A830F919_9EURY|nr:arsinothricin resistance N-acetyltransferase ArsN1 family B [Halarchaeum grantii]GGL31074.1 N-acetyltransferase [Halarchaeum grantii]